MTITSLPTAAGIAQNSRFRPEQIMANLGDVDDLIAEVKERIPTQADYVGNLVAGVRADASQRVAREAIEMRVLYALCLSRAGDNPAWVPRAEHYKAEAQSLIDSLLALPGDDVGVESGGGVSQGAPAFSVSPRRVDGYSCEEGGEYSRRGCW